MSDRPVVIGALHYLPLREFVKTFVKNLQEEAAERGVSFRYYSICCLAWSSRLGTLLTWSWMWYIRFTNLSTARTFVFRCFPSQCTVQSSSKNSPRWRKFTNYLLSNVFRIALSHLKVYLLSSNFDWRIKGSWKVWLHVQLLKRQLVVGVAMLISP